MGDPKTPEALEAQLASVKTLEVEDPHEKSLEEANGSSQMSCLGEICNGIEAATEVYVEENGGERLNSGDMEALAEVDGVEGKILHLCEDAVVSVEENGVGSLERYLVDGAFEGAAVGVQGLVMNNKDVSDDVVEGEVLHISENPEVALEVNGVGTAAKGLLVENGINGEVEHAAVVVEGLDMNSEDASAGNAEPLGKVDIIEGEIMHVSENATVGDEANGVEESIKDAAASTKRCNINNEDTGVGSVEQLGKVDVEGELHVIENAAVSVKVNDVADVGIVEKGSLASNGICWEAKIAAVSVKGLGINNKEVCVANAETIGEVDIYVGQLSRVTENATANFKVTKIGDTGTVEKGSFGCNAVVALDEKSVNVGGSAAGEVAMENKVDDEELMGDEKQGFEGVGSSRKIEVSGENLSVYVDFSGPLDGVNYRNQDAEDYAGLLVDEVGSLETGNEENEGLIGRFHVGDIVWIRTKNKSWWPGKIYDSQDASKLPVKTDQRNCLLVGYLGSCHIAWCLPSHLKPFHENFEQMAGQSKGRSYLGAVEKAADEFGKCLKSEMTCSCILKNGKHSAGIAGIQEGASVLESKLGRFNELLVTQFEPQKLLSQLKNLAKVVSRLSILQLTVTKCLLSAFYQSLGHCQLPMDQLQESIVNKGSNDDRLHGKQCIDGQFGDENSGTAKGNNTRGEFLQKKNEEAIITFGGPHGSVRASNGRNRKKKKFFEFEGTNADLKVTPDNKNGTNQLESSPPTDKITDSRERKKSKYLSYPFVHWGDKGSPSETEDYKMVSEEEESLSTFSSQSISKSSGKRFQKEWYRKFIIGNTVCSNPELLNASVSDLLNELCYTAMDCQYPNDRENFNVIEWFFSKFRISVYHEESIYEAYCKNVIGSSGDALLGKDEQETHWTLPNAKYDQKMHKKKGTGSSSGSRIESSSESLYANIDITTNGSDVDEMSQMGPPTPNAEPRSKKRRKKAGGCTLSLRTKQTTSIPDLNDAGAILKESNMQSAATGTDTGGPVSNSDKSNPFGVDFRNGIQHQPVASASHSLFGVIPTAAEVPSIDLMRKNLEMMTSVLEKSGNKISPETRAKLEGEIKGLLKKVTSLPSPSSEVKP